MISHGSDFCIIRKVERPGSNPGGNLCAPACGQGLAHQTGGSGIVGKMAQKVWLAPENPRADGDSGRDELPVGCLLFVDIRIQKPGTGESNDEFRMLAGLHLVRRSLGERWLPGFLQKDRFGNKRGKARSYYTMAHSTGTHTRLPAASAPAEDELLGLELRVAKRADEIAQIGARGLFHDIEHWLQAERDILTEEQARHRRVR
jgi:hypothetical protein